MVSQVSTPMRTESAPAASGSTAASRPAANDVLIFIR